MSDEIEIEEHDLLDDPTVRNIFPDIARLKQEILDYEYNEEHQEPTSSTSKLHFDNIEEESNSSVNDSSHLSNTSKSHYNNSCEEENCNNDSVSKSGGNIKFPENSQHDGFIRGHRGIEVQIRNNKIILGTKPVGPAKANSDHFEKYVKPYCAFVVLEDFGLYLNNSSRYCKQCLIFFPTNSEYNIHKREIHIETVTNSENVQKEMALVNKEIQKINAVVENRHQKIAVPKTAKLVKIISNDIYKCLKCDKVFKRKDHLKSHLINFHKMSKEILPKMLPKHQIRQRNGCFHCSKTFPTQNLLIEHIYSILQISNKSDKFSNKIVFGNKTNKDLSNKINNMGNEINKVNSKSNVKEIKSKVLKTRIDSDDVDNVTKLFRCHFCFVYFKTNNIYVKHMSIKHKTFQKSNATKVSFDPKCKYCLKTCDSVLKYNRHLYKCHRPALIQAIKKSRKINPSSLRVASKDFSKNYFRCDLCYVYFSNKLHCHRHMTDKHTSSTPNVKTVKFDPKCPYCPKMSYNLMGFNFHLYKNHIDKNSVQISRQASASVTKDETGSSTMSDDNSDKDTKYYTCHFCSLYFRTTRFFMQHMSIKHKMVKKPNTKKFKFNPKCKFCPKICNTARMYNDHVLNCHSQNLNQVNKITITKDSISNRVNISKHIKNQKGTECLRCHVCPSYFMTMTYYVQHMKVRHKTAKIPKPKKVLFDSKCKYCPATINDMKLYNKHLYNKHYSESNEVERAKKTYLISANDPNKKHTNIQQDVRTKSFYRCCYCSYYFNTIQCYNRHVMKKHKVINDHEVKKIIFDPKCKYCTKVTSDHKSYNKHMSSNHWNRIHEVFKERPKIKISKKDDDNAIISSEIQTAHDSKTACTEKKTTNASNVIVPISKSALFKCLKCDIHFLTIKSALDHSNHMELLINWKCALCHRIFKDNDRWLHEKQHLFSHVFTVYDIDQSNISQILYKCSKCVMHFDESVVDSHHYECALKVPQSYMCKICDILVDNKAQICHEYNHKHRHFTSNDFIIIESTAAYEETKKYKGKNNKAADNINSKIEHNQNKGGTSGHTNTPKNNLKRKTMLDENIEVLNRKKMKIDESSVSSQIELKSKKDNINYSSEVSISQQRYDKFSLKLSFCNTCNSFVSMIGQKRKAHAQKRCAHMTSMVCKDCGLKLSSKALTTHRQLHLRIKNLQLHHFKFYDFKSGKRVHPPMPEYETCRLCDVNFISKLQLRNHVCSDTEFKVCDTCKIKVYKPVFHLHIAYHKYKITEISASATLDNAVTSNKTIECENSKNILLLLYCCKVCYVFVDTYDRLIEHCQKHILNNLSPHTEECKICNLPFEESCLSRHVKIHEVVGISFDKLFYDPFYFRCDNTVWLKHVFGSHSHIKKEQIIFNSVYRYEHRFKMEIVQEGTPDMTLYKCVKCNRHVEPDVIYQHVKGSCCNLRKHPCPICEFDFTSSSSLQKHKTIHNDSKVLRYRIIQFNKQEDDELTKVIIGPPNSYVLYQCRYCNVVVGSTQKASHKCNKKAFTSCNDCGLLINEDVYELHSSMHKTLNSFISENMKVILFGQKQSESDKYVAMESTFRGKIRDYSYFKCSNCNVCVKDKNQTLDHTCCWKGQPRVACSICGLYFYADKLISHIKNHETDSDFVLDNMIFIEFHPSKPTPAVDELQNKSKDIENSPSISVDLDSVDELENVQKTGVIMEDSTEVLESDKNSITSLESIENTAVCLENIKENSSDTTIHQKHGNDNAVMLKNAQDTAGIRGSMKDTAESPENVTNTAVNVESVKDTENVQNTGVIMEDSTVVLESDKNATTSLESIENTAVCLENIKENSLDTTIQQKHGNDDAVMLESAHDDAAGIQESVKDTAESPENVTNTAVNIKSVKDTNDSLENENNTIVNMKNTMDSSVSSTNTHNTAITKENKQDTARNQLETNNLPSQNDTEESKTTAVIFHCQCGLHFLDEKSITEHFSQCGSKTKQAKQNCSKCGLLFTPNVLFKHLLTHHGDKNHQFKINIVEKNNKQVIFLHK